MKNTTVDGVSWLECGAGSPIIFLHAMAGSKTAWRPQFERFSKAYRCIAWDMPGFGISAPLADNARMQEVVAALHHFVTKTLGLEKAHFVGLSVGGMILQHFAAVYPQHMTSMTIMDSSPKFGLGGDADPKEFTHSICGQLDSDVSVAEFSASMINAIVAPDCRNTVRQEAIGAMSRATKQGLKLTTHLIAEHDALAKLKAINVPSLVLAGALDAETPPAYAERIAAELLNARASIIPDAGHIANLENPTAVNAQLETFWQELEN
ncbi:alpha/beta fold hydrolase [Maritalea porphyrae]|uniref:alpha/beta fold hydrolase n=1 Tax=Maritalea porphyrae TaxID=880732 RepID=UPI0022AF5043|nr:alpha/beta fold hydrolase [Maritalea porphyrae]MCZ4271255.1 alpha/beta fold hydrolase [Maritalea porphyrae]